jgi:hypothetical protein
MRLPSAQCESFSGWGVGTRGGVTTSKDEPKECAIPRPEVPVAPITPMLSRFGADAICGSFKFVIVSGIVCGSCRCPSWKFDEVVVRSTRTAGAGPGGGARTDDLMRVRSGGPGIVRIGSRSSKAIPNICTMKDASAVHLRWKEWSHVLSNVPNICFPTDRLGCVYRHLWLAL